MTRYEYLCDGCGQVARFKYVAGEAPDEIYHACGGSFRRQYSTWMNMNGLRELAPAVRAMIDNAPRNRDRVAEMKEAHVTQNG